jgi:predicted transcriptional regulator
MSSYANIDALKKDIIEKLYEKDRNISELEKLTGYEKSIVIYGLNELENLGVIKRYKTSREIFKWSALKWITRNNYWYKLLIVR